MMSGVYVVIGAKGGTGRQLVHRLAERSSAEVSEIRALVRDPSTVAADALPTDERVKLLAGDCTDASSLATHLAGAEGVFFAAAGRGWDLCQAVDRDGVLATANAAKAAGCRRVMLVSSQLVDPCNRWSPIRMILNSINTGIFRSVGMMDLKHDGENLLRASGVEYTIVRPGRLLDGPLRAATVRVGQTNGSFLGGPGSTRADVAAACVAAMMPDATGAVNTTFELACDPPPKEGEPQPEPPSAATFRELTARWLEPGTEGAAQI